jgi:hypothetical protein
MARRVVTSSAMQLDEGAERLLHWLERYPFQRAQDLVVALSPWQKRTTVYERLAMLESLHLIEALLAGAASGKRLYHLSPLGMRLCDQFAAEANRENQEKQARWERWEARGNAQIRREERDKLVRLLPRLPVFLLLQDVVNSFIMNASTALTSQGHHARMVQWNWLRDYDHRFVSFREQSLRLHVEGALALCLRFTPTDQPPAQQSHLQPSEGWYTLFLLHCPIDEVRLMRTRLDRLLRWRESAERTVVYSQMPPILIVATTERQAEWWQQAIEQVATRLRVNRPLGALTCLSQTDEALTNGWRLHWRKLGTNESCHVQELLQPSHAPAVPELLVLHRSAIVGTHTGEKRKLILSSRRCLHSYALTNSRVIGRASAARTRRLSGSNAESKRDYRLASVSLTPRHWEILNLCFAHPFLAREDLSHLLVLSRTTVNLLLADLQRAGYLVGAETQVGERWQLAEAGLRLLARLAFCHVHRLVRLPQDVGMPLTQRGALGMFRQIQHTASVYAFFSTLSASLATLSNARVRWWETGVISERHFVYRGKTYRFRPDALATVQLGERNLRFWLEWDRGTMTPSNLRIKFATYAMYLASREWANSSPYLPVLLCVTPDIAQEQRLVQAAINCLGQVPTAFRIYTTTASLLVMQGILAPIWQQVVLPRQQTQQKSPDIRRRVAVFTDK